MKYLFWFLWWFLTTSVWAIILTLPPSDGNKDIVLPWPTQVESNADVVINYIKLANDYLRFAMIVVAFAVLVWMGFKLFTNEAGSDEAKNVMKNGFIALWSGIVIILFSYTIVRLVINLL